MFNKIYKCNQISVIFHVDDLLAACVFKEGLEKLYEVLIKKYEEVEVTRGERHSNLGMIVNFKQSGVVVIGNPGFMLNLMKEHGEATFSTTPAGENLFDVRESPPLSIPDAKHFHSLSQQENHA